MAVYYARLLPGWAAKLLHLFCSFGIAFSRRAQAGRSTPVADL
jgi:hypothetical protein